MPFPAPLPAPKRLTDTSTAREYILAYLALHGLSQNRLATRVRQPQQRISRIINGKCKNVDVQTIVAICLALGLNEKQSIDLLARFERALSPANPVHKTYRRMITLYSSKAKEEDFFEESSDGDILYDADEYLKSKNQPTFPDIYE